MLATELGSSTYLRSLISDSLDFCSRNKLASHVPDGNVNDVCLCCARLHQTSSQDSI